MTADKKEITKKETQTKGQLGLQEIKEIASIISRASKEWKSLEAKVRVDNKGEITADVQVIFDYEKDETMTIEEVSDYLEVDEQSIQELLNSGALKSFKVGRTTRIMRSELKRFIENHTDKE